MIWYNIVTKKAVGRERKEKRANKFGNGIMYLPPSFPVNVPQQLHADKGEIS